MTQRMLSQDFERALQLPLSDKADEGAKNIALMVFNSVHHNDVNYLSRVFDKVLLSDQVLKQEFADLSKANQSNQMSVQVATSIRALVDTIVDLNTMTVKPGLIDLIGQDDFNKILKMSKNDQSRMIHSLVKGVELMYTQGLVEWVGKQGPLSTENKQILERMNALATNLTVKSLLSPAEYKPQSINLDALPHELELRTQWLNEEIANFPNNTLYGGLRKNLVSYFEKIDGIKQKLEYNMPVDPVAIDHLFMEIAITQLIVMVKNIDELLLKDDSGFGAVHDVRVALENKRHQLNGLLARQMVKSNEIDGSKPVNKANILTMLMSIRDDLEHIANDHALPINSKLDLYQQAKRYWPSYAKRGNSTPNRDIGVKLTDMKETLRVLRERDNEPKEKSSYQHR